MNLNMVTSELRFLGNSIQNLAIENNLDILTEDTEKSFGMDIDLLECQEQDGLYLGSILLTIELKLKEADKEASIVMDLKGDFCGEKVSKEEFTKLLLINGAAALYSIARGKMEAISALSFENGKLSLPFVNIVDFYRDKFKN